MFPLPITSTPVSPLFTTPLTPIYLSDEIAKTSVPLSPIFIDKPIITSTKTIYPSSIIMPRSIISLTANDEMNENYFVQKQMTEYLHFRILDKWLYDEDMCYLLKYLKVENGKVSVVKSASDVKDNKLCEETKESVTKKIDYIENHILTKEKMKHILTKVLYKTGIRWYNLALPSSEKVIVRATEKYLRKKFKKILGMN